MKKNVKIFERRREEFFRKWNYEDRNLKQTKY